MDGIPVVHVVPTGHTTSAPQPGTYYRINGGPRLCLMPSSDGFIFTGAVGTPDLFLSTTDLQQTPLSELALIPVTGMSLP